MTSKKKMCCQLNANLEVMMINQLVRLVGVMIGRDECRPSWILDLGSIELNSMFKAQWDVT